MLNDIFCPDVTYMTIGYLYNAFELFKYNIYKQINVNHEDEDVDYDDESNHQLIVREDADIQEAFISVFNKFFNKYDSTIKLNGRLINQMIENISSVS